MKILDMPCTKGFMQIAQDGVDKGWHEMNGGNLSYRLTDAETKNVKSVCKKPATGWTELGESVPKTYPMVSVSPKFLVDILYLL